MDNIRFEDWEAEQMQDPEFRAAVEKLEPVYQVERLRIMRDKSGRNEDEMLMDIKPIRTNEDYKAALEEIDKLFDAESDTPECDKEDTLDAEEKNDRTEGPSNE